jgi:hypothetical protein
MPEPTEISDRRSQLFELLLSEKEYADRQIGANLEANLKLLGTVFTVVVAVLGWVLAQKGGQALDLRSRGIILLCLVALSSIGSLMGTVFNGFAFGYVAYKEGSLGPRFCRYLGLTENPLAANKFIGRSAARLPILAGTAMLGLCQSLLAIMLFVAGTWMLNHSANPGSWTVAPYWCAVPLAGLLLCCSLVGSGLMLWALNDLRRGDRH